MRKIGQIKNLIIDTDMGWDDVLAILLLIKNPNYNILGITVTGCGETHLEQGVELALQLVTLGNQPDICVCAGADKTGQYNHQFPESFRDMMDDACGLRDKLPAAESTKDQRNAWEFINDCLNEQENQITILSLGGLTNIQKLIEMQPFPALENIERIVVMGGAIDVDGNVAALNNSNKYWDQGTEYASNTYAEWNIFLDPKAAQVTFNSGIPIKLVPLDACDYAILDKTYYQLVTAKDAVANFVRALLYQKTEGSAQENIPLPVFDPLAAIEMTNDLVKSKYEKMRIGVKTTETKKDNTCGQTYITTNKSVPEIEVVTKISANEFKQRFQESVNSPLCPRLNENISKNIAILIYDQIEIQDFAGAFEIFSAARNDDNSSVFNVFTVAADKAPITCNSGVTPTGGKSSSFKITADHTLDCHPKIDTLYIIGGPGIDALLDKEAQQPFLTEWISIVSEEADYVAGTCSGALLLVLSKQLKNMNVTTHHTRFEQMDALSEKYSLGLNVLDTRNGEQYIHNPRSKFMTSGGVTCGLALSLHIVELYQGLARKESLAKDVLEYTIPRGVAHPESYSASHMDPAHFVLGFSHLNIIVSDLAMMDDATRFYKRTLGFREAWSVWLSPESCEHFARDAGFADGKGKVMVRFLIHPNAQFHLELMYYEYPKGNQKISFHKTNDVGGIRHVALEVNNILEVYDWLKNQEGVKMLSDTPPEKLTPDPQTFFYWIDPYGVQWEMEEGRPMARVINGTVG
ncbi:Inosine/uridine-preferring nucleoside hydrolase [Psychromonas ingrahamii 37]|uniref:Inosine/uridine-preferring nucleoside hydrolase n=1 Tax=Psychromonas ingrahamii (strain DSM 17664 / CCUG 51855 / 37) TaxID=357804 RepID=A1SW12_PSYIN|nr:nucleoside hydrolase [Psychromonas ingrahamii]ABM03677.1 Inosine/uridine-preferring nucleoside hydrolase [Psychromonas ingrahamii 37]